MIEINAHVGEIHTHQTLQISSYMIEEQRNTQIDFTLFDSLIYFQ